jgi:hypothetical protein
MAQGRGSRPSSSSPLGEQPGNDAAAVYVDVTVADENGFPAVRASSVNLQTLPLRLLFALTKRLTLLLCDRADSRNAR